MKNYLSYSRINAFLQCPLKYKLLYIDKIQLPDSKAISFGNFIHSVLEKYIKKIVQMKTEKDLNIFEDIMKWSWENVYGKILDKLDYENAKQMILNYIENGLDYKNILGCECFLDVYFSELSLKMNLKVDRIDSIRDGTGIKIIDYKSGDDMNFEESDLQALIYSYSVQTLYKNKEFFEVNWVFLKNGVTRNVPIINTEDSKKIILEKAKLVLDAKEFNPCKNKFCDGCGFKNEYCPLFKGEQNV